MLLTEESIEYSKRHDGYTNQEIGDSQRQQEVIRDVLQASLQAYRQTHEHVPQTTGDDQQNQQQEQPIPLLDKIVLEVEIRNRVVEVIFARVPDARRGIENRIVLEYFGSYVDVRGSRYDAVGVTCDVRIRGRTVG